MKFFKYYLLFIIYAILSTQYASRVFGQGSQITQGGSAYAISSPYAAEDLFEIQYVQSANVMYLVQSDYPPQILTRSGDTQWAIEDVNLLRGPFMTENEDADWTLTPSATTGDITITASKDTFDPSHVGALWQITGLVDANIVTGTIDEDESSSVITVGLNQNYTMHIEGLALCDIAIERSYDDKVSWSDVYSVTFTGVLNESNRFLDTEVVADAYYRLTATNWVSMPVFVMAWVPEARELNYTLISHAYEREGVVEITGVSDARNVTATVKYELASTAATRKWSEGCFSGYRGYPAAVCFHHERLTFGGTKDQPDTIWLSQTDDWHNFLVNIYDTSSLRFTLSADQVNAIRWLKSHNDLIIGTSGGEWKLSTPLGKALTQTNVPIAHRQSTLGSAPIQSLLINDQVVYVQRNAKKIQRMGYTYESDSWNSVDLSLMSEHLTGEGMIELAYQRTPFSILWSVCGNGDLLALVLEDNQEVMGWSRYVFDGDCESVCVIPGTGEDKVWIIVAREIDGETKRYIEQFMPIAFEDQDSAYYVDCGLSFDGGAAISVTNITQADPAVVTAPEHTFTDGDQVRFSDVGGMEEVNYRVYSVSTVSGASFELKDSTDDVDVNSVGFTAYTSGGTIEQVENAFDNYGHLEGKSVVAAGDGGYAGDYTVATGDVTLDDYYNRVHIGLPYTAKLKPMRLDFLATGGALQGRTKRISALTVRFYETLSCSVGPTWTDYDSFVFRQATDPLEAATPLLDNAFDKYMLFDGGFETAGDICVQDALPVPLTVLGIIVEYEVER